MLSQGRHIAVRTPRPYGPYIVRRYCGHAEEQIDVGGVRAGYALPLGAIPTQSYRIGAPVIGGNVLADGPYFVSRDSRHAVKEGAIVLAVSRRVGREAGARSRYLGPVCTVPMQRK